MLSHTLVFETLKLDFCAEIFSFKNYIEYIPGLFYRPEVVNSTKREFVNSTKQKFHNIKQVNVFSMNVIVARVASDPAKCSILLNFLWHICAENIFKKSVFLAESFPILYIQVQNHSLISYSSIY